MIKVNGNILSREDLEAMPSGSIFRRALLRIADWFLKNPAAKSADTVFGIVERV
jgi:hypothetical protein